MLNKTSIDIPQIKHKIEYIKKEERLQRVYELALKHSDEVIAIYSEIRSEIEDIRDYLRLKQIK